VEGIRETAAGSRPAAVMSSPCLWFLQFSLGASLAGALLLVVLLGGSLTLSPATARRCLEHGLVIFCWTSWTSASRFTSLVPRMPPCRGLDSPPGPRDSSLSPTRRWRRCAVHVDDPSPATLRPSADRIRSRCTGRPSRRTCAVSRRRSVARVAVDGVVAQGVGRAGGAVLPGGDYLARPRINDPEVAESRPLVTFRSAMCRGSGSLRVPADIC